MKTFAENIRRLDSFPSGSVSALEELLSAPFVVTGYVRKWPAFRKWTAEFFSMNYGDHIVKVFARDNHEVSMTIREYLAYVANFEKNGPEQELYYLRDWTFDYLSPELKSDYVTPDLFKCWTDALPGDQRPSLRWIYVGVKGTETGLHLDTMNSSAWNGVIQGKKRWTFLPPESAHPSSTARADETASSMDAITCIQHEGDLIYTPSGWLHKVENLESGISVTENFINTSNYRAVRQYLVERNENEYVAILDQLVEKNIVINRSSNHEEAAV